MSSFPRLAKICAANSTASGEVTEVKYESVILNVKMQTRSMYVVNA